MLRLLGLMMSVGLLASASEAQLSAAACAAGVASIPQMIDSAGEFLCQAPPIGKQVFVHQRPSDSPTKIPTMYVLTRTRAKHYKLEFNIDFVETNLQRGLTNLVNPGSSSPPEAAMKARVKSCLRELNPLLKGPNGQSLELSLIDPVRTDGNYRTIRADIEIAERGFRSHSRKYAADINCLAVVHELLHLAGLVDEYQELDPKHEKTCRVYGMENSIMRSVHEISGLENFNPGKGNLTQVLTARCYCHDPKVCRGKSPDKYCLSPGFRENRQAASFDKSLGINSSNFKSYMFQGVSGGGIVGMIASDSGSMLRLISLTNFDERPEGSLLYPAHFRALTFPACTKANKKYFECAQFSYKNVSRKTGECEIATRNC
ncbi:MAG TPA: hypothetical protein VM432_07965, partial [Bdellovibrionales bacterium]|nr:hypothetical protein [Bdellovibrionales bacterium]